MRSERRRRAEVVGYWRSVELFGPARLPVAPRTSAREWVRQVEVRTGEPWPSLPWQEGHPLGEERIDADREVWRHTVYGGVFTSDAVRGVLEARFGADPEDHPGVRARQGESAVFALTVDADGVLLEGTVALSSCAWATGRVRRPGVGAAGWLEGFGAVEAGCARAIKGLGRRQVGYGEGGETSGGWRGAVLELLGPAAVGAVGALLGGGGRRVPGQRGDGVGGGEAGGDGSRGAVGAAVDSAHSAVRALAVGHARVDGAELRREPGSRAALHVPQGTRRPLELPDLVAFAAHAADLCGVTDLLSPAVVRVHSRRVRRRADGSLPDARPARLNSLLSEDLARVAGADDHGVPLTAYLTAPGNVPTAARTDVREHPEAVLEAVAPGATPLGCWPAPEGRPLDLSGQFVVNTVLAELSDSGLFSVTAPPGTGRGSVFRDLVAAVVVERATRLAALARPTDAFTGEAAGGVSRLLPELTGHEIVVATPDGATARDVAARLLTPDALGGAPASPAAPAALAWDTLAAPLGDAEQHREFLHRLHRWSRDERPGEPPNDDAGPGTHPGPGTRLGTHPELDPNPDLSTTPTWGTAKAAFLHALRHSRALRDDRASAARALHNLPHLDAAVTSAEAANDSARENENRASAALSAARTDLRRATAAHDRARDRAERHRANRPGGLRGALGAGRAFTEWQDGDRWLQGELNRAHLARGAASGAALAAERARDEAAELYRHAQDRLRRAREAASEAGHRVARARAVWGAHVPEDRLDVAERELSSPWADEEFRAARTHVFLAALDLHRAFVAANARTVRRNLLALDGVLAGEAPPEVALAVWRSLFLVVPVVSTTYASCARLFGPLGAGSLGWVLVDGAGRAAPQAVVGALWRARRAVLAGDPFRLGPSAVVPVSVQERLRKAYGVDEAWLPARGSAQAVADRVNVLGTAVRPRLPGGAAVPVWAGAPLRVHRQCERTVFELVDGLAYDGLLVHGTVERPFPGGRLCHACVADGRAGCRECVYPLSCWVDVLPGGAVGAWVPEEGVALERVLTLLHREWRVGLDRVRVLSPFREVAAGCVRTVREMRLESPPPGVSYDAYRRQVAGFVAGRIGTVHGLRGGADDVVVLVLGTHPRDGSRARAWAAASPALLTTAVSRARRRLFVVGHQETWGAEPHFSLLSGLPRHPWPAGGRAVVSGVRYQ
ncbi:hypothetical protein ABZX85_30255 [Streptomyces sp. NPDC004539]|uniref:hypothetical protein n=1 Tax=Streptomyces sp. NPDC004539 TaxID=3154280 RepID=UPI0033B0EBE0